jgi:hypothetical protein
MAGAKRRYALRIMRTRQARATHWQQPPSFCLQWLARAHAVKRSTEVKNGQQKFKTKKSPGCPGLFADDCSSD